MPMTKRFFALFGARATGKSAYLAALYGSGGGTAGGGAYHVAAGDSPDDPTHSYLGRIVRKLRSGQWPDPTAFEKRPELMTIHFTMGDLARELVLPDVGGELTKRDGQDTPDLKAEILASYQDYHGFLIFIPADVTDPKRAVQSKWELDVLLNALRERVSEGQTKIARPFAILVTKWDLIEPGPLDEGSEARTEAFFDKIHPDQSSGLRTICENFRIFPVSATGPLDAGRPPVPLRPTNLGEPIAWLIETAERVMLERAIASVERNRAKLFRIDPKDDRRRTFLAVARARLENFLKDVPHGPLADEATARLQELRAITFRRRKRRAVIATVILACVAFAGFGRRDYLAYRKAHDLLDGSSPELSRRQVVARVDAVVRESGGSRPVGHALMFWRKLRRDLVSYRAEFEARSFEKLARRSPPADAQEARTLLEKIKDYEADFPDSSRIAKVADLRFIAEDVARTWAENQKRARIDEDHKRLQDHPHDPGLATNLRDECEDFLKGLPKSSHVPIVQTIRAEAQAVLDTMTLAKNYEELQANVSRAAESPLRCHQLCAEFLQNNPSHPRAKEVATDRDRFLRKADDQAWAEVDRNARAYPTDFRDQIGRCEDYQHNALFTNHQQEANEFRKLAIRKYDRASYEAICAKARSGDHPATLQAVRNLCSEYLNAPIPSKAMTNVVESWAKWFDEWGKGREFHVRVVSVRIDRDSAWHYRTWLADPWVHASVQVGARTHYTGDRWVSLGSDVRELPNDRLGPFTWKWGDPEVVVSLVYKNASPPQFSANFDDSGRFKVRNLNGQTNFDGGKIAVRLECPEVLPPSLPPYKD